MNVQWVTSPNYWAGRTQKVSKIVIHWMAGNLAGTDVVFQNPAKEVSAHYGIEDGTVHQYVRTEDTAWHARQANPFSIGIEHSAAPGRLATDKTYNTSIELVASLCKQYGLDPNTAIVPHKEYVATACPGTIDLDRIKKGVVEALVGEVVPPPVPEKPPLPQPPANQQTGGSLSLPGNATSWRVYKETGPYTIGSEVGTLNPSLFGGLTYDILGNPTANVYTIQTRDFGRVAIYTGAETGATVAATGQGTANGSGASKNVYLPPTPTWRVYKESGPYSVGHEIGCLAPAKYNGLTYAILARPVANVVVIQTQTFGRVAIYVGAETGARIN